jgi:putative endonuclease
MWASWVSLQSSLKLRHPGKRGTRLSGTQLTDLDVATVIPDGHRPIRDPASTTSTLRDLANGPGYAYRMVGRDPVIAAYILASGRNGTLYTGVTSGLQRRVHQHKLGVFEGFSKTYGCKSLVWYETHATMAEAIGREKRIKRWRRKWKLALIEADNPQWRDLSDEWFAQPEGPLSWMQAP